MESNFNLIDEEWIPVVGVGKVSLGQIFKTKHYRSVGGNPVQKMAILKLLLAIAQAAHTPQDEDEWESIGESGLAAKCEEYLVKWHDRFDLYGNHPFIQIPEIKQAEIKNYGVLMPEVATGNTSVLTQWQKGSDFSNADKALLLVTQMAFALGGKKTDNAIVLSKNYAGKKNEAGRPATSKPGSAVAYMGLLHNIILGETLWQTVWLNLLSQEQIQESQLFPSGVGVPPWEKTPSGEDCVVARELKDSLMGRLVPVGRFCLLTDAGIHYSEGIQHDDYNSGKVDPTVAVIWGDKKTQVLWCNVDKRPWRELTALLGFISQGQSTGFNCLQLQVGIPRACKVASRFSLWSGGMAVSSNAGEQYLSGRDDFVESEIWLSSASLGEVWLEILRQEVRSLDEIGKILYVKVMGYFKDQLVDGKKYAADASNFFWHLCEADFQTLVGSCSSQDTEKRHELRVRYAGYVQTAYDKFCHKNTARQLDTWVKNRPNLGKYLKRDESNE